MKPLFVHGNRIKLKESILRVCTCKLRPAKASTTTPPGKPYDWPGRSAILLVPVPGFCGGYGCCRDQSLQRDSFGYANVAGAAPGNAYAEGSPNAAFTQRQQPGSVICLRESCLWTKANDHRYGYLPNFMAY